jgi:DNA-binding transcriptional regulator YiaG
MTAKPKFKSDAMEAIFESAQAMHAAGAITDLELREYERDCFASPRASRVQLPAKPRRPVPASA